MGAVPSILQPPDQPVDSYVLPLVLATKVGPTTSRLLGVFGTGFLLADGRGLGVTAGHVAKDLEPAVGEREYPAVGFRQTDLRRKIVPVANFERHPTEDVALFRLQIEDDYVSPYTVNAVTQFAGSETVLWGYPDDVHYDLMGNGRRDLVVALVYSGGHIRRCVDYELPIDRVPGRCFYELSNPAGSCCSGAPVSLRTPEAAWQAIGVYVGERRNETNTFSVGYATRSEALVAQWPQLVNRGDAMAALCVP